MLFNLRIFKKLVKEAYKGGGLIVGREGEEYIFCGGNWAMRIKEEAFEKEYKAAVIEHIGDLPKDGELVRKSKGLGDGEVNDLDRQILKMRDIKGACDPADLTNVYMDISGRLCRVVQCQNRNILMKEELIALVEENKKEGMKGPFSNPSRECQLYWYDNRCNYTVYTMDTRQETKAQQVLEQLQAVDLGR